MCFVVKFNRSFLLCLLGCVVSVFGAHSETFVPMSLIDSAMNMPLLYNITDSNIDTEIKNDGAIGKDKMLFAMALESYRNPALVDSEGNNVADKVVEHLRNIISGGKEPACRGDLSAWKEIGQAFAITFMKKNPVLWEKFTLEEQEKLDLLMRSFAVAGNYQNNFANWPKCCIYQTYQIGKTWNPNHNDGYVGIMIAAYHYFGGAEQVNAFLTAFDYDQYMDDFREAGFTNIIECWSQAGKDLFETGGTDAMGGKLVGVRIPFVMAHPLYNDQVIAYNPVDLYCAIGDWMYCHKVTDRSASGVAYIMNEGSSPVLGQAGMCREFQITDGFPPNVQERSDAVYSYLGWMLHIPTVSAMMALGDWNTSERLEDTERRMYVGSEDLIYKLEKGYRAFSKGNASTQYASHLRGDGYPCVEALWEYVVKPQCEEHNGGQVAGLHYSNRDSEGYALSWNGIENAVRYSVMCEDGNLADSEHNMVQMNSGNGDVDTLWVQAELSEGKKTIASSSLVVGARVKMDNYELVDDVEGRIEWVSANPQSVLYRDENPVMNDVNPSEKCIRLSRNVGSDYTAGMLLMGDVFSLSEESRYLHVKLYRGVEGGVAVRMNNAIDTLWCLLPLNATDTLKKAQWVDYVFDMNECLGKTYDELTIYPDRTKKYSGKKNYYVDDVCLSRYEQPFTAGFGWDDTALQDISEDALMAYYDRDILHYRPMCASCVNQIEVYDMVGRPVMSRKDYSLTPKMRQISMHLSQGVYVVRVSSGQNYYKTIIRANI